MEPNSILLPALDKFDSVSMTNSLFPSASFLVEFDRFECHIEKLNSEKDLHLDYISICIPNYLHDSHSSMS